MSPGRLRAFAVALSLVGASPLIASAAASELDRLAELAPGLRPAVLERALAALDCASDPAIGDSRVLAVIDYAIPSTERRLWVFDRRAPRLLFHALVAHGSGTGENRAERFSNRHGSRQSSLGLFGAAEPYVGRNGYSLRLDGLDPGVNDQARSRAIVVHGAWYVTDDFATHHGRLGRSWGCPALEPELARPILDTLRNGGALFVSAEDPEWLERTAGRACIAAGPPAGSARPALDSRRPGP